MQTNGNLFTRNDTMLGVCEGLGEDLGIHANWLRLAFAGVLFLSPVAAFATYAALGVLVFASRMLFPRRVAVQATGTAETPPIAGDNDQVEYKLAA